VGADGRLQFHRVGNDVALRAPLDTADGDHRRGMHIDLAADQIVEGEYHACGQVDRIDRVVGIRTVATLAVDDQPKAVDIGRRPAGARTYLAVEQRGVIVQRQRTTGPTIAGEYTSGEHRRGPIPGLLGRLDDQQQPTRHGRTQVRQDPHRAERHSQVDVVTASVHHPHLASAAERIAPGRGERQTSHLGHR